MPGKGAEATLQALIFAYIIFFLPFALPIAFFIKDKAKCVIFQSCVNIMSFLKG